MMIGSIAAGLTAAPAGAAGILPPAAPPANIVPSSADWLTSIDQARAREGVGNMPVFESQLDTLPLAEQVFAAVNDERIDRGLPPIDDMTAQLNTYAQGGANSGTDPSFPSSLTGGAPITFGGALWAGGVSSALEADYYWMYDDGFSGASTVNAFCAAASPSSCWFHRAIILHQFANCPTGPPVLSMGAAYSPVGGGSIAVDLVSSCVAAERRHVDLGPGGAHRLALADGRPRGEGNGSGYWEAEANGTVAAFGSAQDHGSLSGQLNSPIVGIVATPDGGGYWAGGRRRRHLQLRRRRLPRVDGVAAPQQAHRRHVVHARRQGLLDGGLRRRHLQLRRRAVLRLHGRHAAQRADRRHRSDATTGGYWEVASDGGIFSYDAPFLGSTGSIRLNEPIVGMEGSPDGEGYRFVASDGGIFTYGQAPFDGSTGGMPLVAPVVGMAPDNVTNGYWMAAADGGIFTFGGAP